MNLLYVARNYETGELVTFEYFSELQSFSKEHKYAYNYFAVPKVEEYMDEELFLEEGDDPSDFL